jgi:hypothetical protein
MTLRAIDTVQLGFALTASSGASSIFFSPVFQVSAPFSGYHYGMVSILLTTDSLLARSFDKQTICGL